MDPIEEILRLFRERGGSEYGGEQVTQLEHALQAAFLAEQQGASASMVVAALLHDIGHLLHELPDDAPEKGIDDHHEASASNFLRKHFPASITEPVRLHVAAKRYLCAADADYLAQLSEPSVVSLRLQGGPMDEDEQREFESNESFEDALALRRWDDTAKDPDAQTPSLEHFGTYLRKVVNS